MQVTLVESVTTIRRFVCKMVAAFGPWSKDRHVTKRDQDVRAETLQRQDKRTSEQPDLNEMGPKAEFAVKQPRFGLWFLWFLGGLVVSDKASHPHRGNIILWLPSAKGTSLGRPVAPPV